MFTLRLIHAMSVFVHFYSISHPPILKTWKDFSFFLHIFVLRCEYQFSSLSPGLFHLDDMFLLSEGLTVQVLKVSPGKPKTCC